MPFSSRNSPPTFLLAVSISASSPFSLSMASTAGLTADLSPASLSCLTTSPASVTLAFIASTSSALGAFSPDSAALSAAPRRVVTWNISPAPSQSDWVMSGVWT